MNDQKFLIGDLVSPYIRGVIEDNSFGIVLDYFKDLDGCDAYKVLWLDSEDCPFSWCGDWQLELNNKGENNYGI